MGFNEGLHLFVFVFIILCYQSVQSSTPVPKISSNGLADEMARMEVIGITRDVQKFLATISELRQAMDELDNECKGMCI